MSLKVGDTFEVVRVLESGSLSLLFKNSECITLESNGFFDLFDVFSDKAVFGSVEVKQTGRLVITKLK